MVVMTCGDWVGADPDTKEKRVVSPFFYRMQPHNDRQTNWFHPMNHPETQAMSSMLATLAQLKPESRKRVLDGLVRSFDAEPFGSSSVPQTERIAAHLARMRLHELLEGTDPSSKTECALVVACWLQARRGGAGWTGAELNATLHDIGGRLSNVTRTLTALAARRPAFVAQVRASSRSSHARKTYRVSTAGELYVLQLLGQNTDRIAW